jgi:hypothetical protein
MAPYIPYVLFAASAVFAWSEFNFGNPAGLTPAGRMAGSLGYAFSPLLISLLIAGIMSRFHKLPGRPSAFRSNLNKVWAILLTMLAIDHVATLINV